MVGWIDGHGFENASSGPSSLSFLSKFKPQSQPFPLPRVDLYINLLHKDLGVSTDQTANLETLALLLPPGQGPGVFLLAGPTISALASNNLHPLL